jgi:maltose alpha-D-glucosyltransferase/alpha-amylase
VTRAAVEAALGRLDRDALAAERWFAAKGRTIGSIELEDAFELDTGAPQVLAIARLGLDDGSSQRYTFALTGHPLRPAEPGDGTWRALAAAMAEGRAIGAIPADGGPASVPTAALVCRPGPAMSDGIADATERHLGADQSNTSVVLDEAVLLKAYRRLHAGLNPELELVAFLSEEVGFPAVPPLAGYVELVSASEGLATVAVAQAFVADGADLFESLADALVAWLLAPGEVSLEFATEVAADVGALTAGLHVALASRPDIPELAPRDATRAEIRGWATAARAHLDEAIAATSGETRALLRDLSPEIAESFTVFDGLSSVPRVIRAHGDLHLGQVLVASDGYRVVDFEGDPLDPIETRRAHRSPLRDVAVMLLSLDHVAGTAGRRAEARNGGPLEQPGLDLAGWVPRAQERFLGAYRDGLREAGEPSAVDAALLRAFEIDKETAEFTYAATYMPSWLWAPTEGIRRLIGPREG